MPYGKILRGIGYIIWTRYLSSKVVSTHLLSTRAVFLIRILAAIVLTLVTNASFYKRMRASTMSSCYRTERLLRGRGTMPCDAIPPARDGMRLG